MQQSFPGDTGTVIYKGGAGPQPIIQGVPSVQQQQPQQPMIQQLQQQQQQQQMAAMARGPLPVGPEDESFPPPPPMRAAAANGNASADASLNDSNSTTQSNLASECSEAECDREPLVKNGGRQELILASFQHIFS